jgi:hypothetical protein
MSQMPRKLVDDQRRIGSTEGVVAARQARPADDNSKYRAQEDEREGRLRRMAERRRMRLRASTCGRPDRYMLVDAVTQETILGGSPFRYSATLDDVARYLLG